jgi:iron only hydrogenase large subunit-like protein
MVTSYYHAHRVMLEKCRGHMRCMRNCPTQAIRVRNGKAGISGELCVDCAACLQVCPEKAIEPIADPVGEVSRFKYKVVVPGASLYSQFKPDTHPYIIHMALKELGFDAVVDVGQASVALAKTLIKYVGGYKGRLPLISSYCPSVVRLIQVKYPDLVEQIVPLNVPREITAMEIRRSVTEKLGIAPEDIGIVYLVSCPAKILSIKQPAEKAESNFDGAVSIVDACSVLMPKVREISETFDESMVPRDWVFGAGWGRTGSILRQAKKEGWMAVSGISNVTQMLDDIEKGRLRYVEFIEAWVHPGGCIGGPFCIENPYVALHTCMLQRERFETELDVPDDLIQQRFEAGYYFLEKPILPRSPEFFDTDLETSIKRMKERERVYKKLRQIDCGCCGAPTCMAFAEDFVKGDVKFTDCIWLGGKSQNNNSQE